MHFFSGYSKLLLTLSCGSCPPLHLGYPDNTTGLCWCETGQPVLSNCASCHPRNSFNKFFCWTPAPGFHPSILSAGKPPWMTYFGGNHRDIWTKDREWQGMGVVFLVLYHSPLKMALQHRSEIGISKRRKWLSWSCGLVLEAYSELGPADWPPLYY